jgi:hypothetical protein
MEHIYSYPTVYALGHSAIIDIFKDPVLLEEKIDGSQFSFSLNMDGELLCRSKGKQMILDAPEHMFEKAVVSIRNRVDLLHPDWIYRCEYLEKPHHNTLNYERIPKDNLIGFDIGTELEVYMSYEDKVKEFKRIGFECVPKLYEGMIESIDQFMPFLDKLSILGGTNIEGVVAKNYTLFTKDKKIAIGKYVSEKFKEVNAAEWKHSNPTQSDILGELITRYRTPARWNKAIQHLREQGLLEDSPRDIGKLIVEAQIDTEKECEEEIKDILYKHFMPKIKRGIISGLPEWYKEQLLGNAFQDKTDV